MGLCLRDSRGTGEIYAGLVIRRPGKGRETIAARARRYFRSEGSTLARRPSRMGPVTLDTIGFKGHRCDLPIREVKGVARDDARLWIEPHRDSWFWMLEIPPRADDPLLVKLAARRAGELVLEKRVFGYPGLTGNGSLL